MTNKGFSYLLHSTYADVVNETFPPNVVFHHSNNVNYGDKSVKAYHAHFLRGKRERKETLSLRNFIKNHQKLFEKQNGSAAIEYLCKKFTNPWMVPNHLRELFHSEPCL